MHRAHLLVSVAIGLGLGLGGCSEPTLYCDAPSMASALAAAQPGDVVSIGACAMDGPFVVPPGVTLAGRGITSVLSTGPSGEPAVEFAEGEGGTLRDVRVDVLAGGIGVRAVGAGDATLEGVVLHVSQGIGIGAQGRARVELRGVKLEGPIDPTNAAFASSSRTETGTYAVIAIDVGSEADTSSGLRVQGLRVAGFAVAGVAVDGGRLDWVDDDTDDDVNGSDDIDVEQVRGVGVAIFDAPASIVGVELGETLAGAGYPGIGMAAVNSPAFSIRSTRIDAGAGYGVFSDESATTIDTLAASGLGLTAFRVQGGSLDATALALEGNGGAGVLAIDTTRVAIRSSTIRDHRDARIPDELGGTRSMADGLVVVRRATGLPETVIDLELTDVVFEGNARSGLLVDAAGTAPARVAITGVRAASSGTAFGAIAQDAMMPAGWDSAITREGAAIANDGAFPGSGLEIAGIIMPPALMARPGAL